MKVSQFELNLESRMGQYLFSQNNWKNNRYDENVAARFD